ncbi:MAG: hypothetical protein WBP45_04565 [Daejeonella sp.]
MMYEKLIQDMFKSEQYSRNELNLFISDLISRSKKAANPVPVITAEVTVLEPIYQSFSTGLGKLGAKGAFQKAGTISKQDAYDDALDFIRSKEGVIKDIFKKGSAAYIEFYPQGLKQYNTASVEGMKTLLASYAEVAAKYKTDLGAAFITKVTELLTAYATARDEQVDKKTDKSSIQSQLRASRKELTKQLTKCVLLIAAYTIEDANAFNSYFNFGLLQVDNDKNTGGENATDPVQ